MPLSSLQAIDLTAIVRRLEEPAQGVLVRIINLLWPFFRITVSLAMITALWAHNANHALALTVFFTLLIFSAIPLVLMVIVWFRDGVSLEARLKRLQGLSPLSIDGVNYDLTDIQRVFKRVAARFGSAQHHQPPNTIERFAIAALFGAPLPLFILMIGLNPEPLANSSWLAHVLFALDIGFYYLLVGANGSRGKHAWARTVLNKWSRAVGYLTCLAATAVVVVVLFNVFPPTDKIDKDHPTASIPALAAFLFMLSPKLMGDSPNGSATDRMSADRRAPVLFLRSFEDEGMAAPSTMSWSDDGTSARFYIMVLLRHRLEQIGPVVAIADPANPEPVMFDAARSEIPDEKWRVVAADWMKSAAMIVMMGGRTQGAQWELRHIVFNGHLDKLLLLFPPHRDWRNVSAADRWNNILACFAGSPFYDELSKMDAQLIRAIAFTQSGQPVVFLSQTAVSTDYELAGMLGILTLLRQSGTGLRSTQAEAVRTA